MGRAQGEDVKAAAEKINYGYGAHIAERFGGLRLALNSEYSLSLNRLLK